MTKQGRKRALRGRGAVVQRKDGRWQAMLSLGFDPLTGKRLRRFVYARTAEEADAKLAALKTRIRSGAEPAARSREGRGTLGAFLEDWLSVTRQRVRASTIDDYDRQVRLHVKPTLGAVPLDRVTPRSLTSLDARLAEAGVGNRTRSKVYTTLRAAFRYAVRHELLQRSPLDRVEPPTYRAPRREPLSLDEVRQLFTAIDGHRLEALFVLAIGTGMREGELFGLMRKDVDLERGSIYIANSLQDINGKLVVSEVKTERSRRAIDIPRRALALLKWHLRTEGPSDAHVFTDTRGGRLRRSNFLRDVWYPLLEQAELRRVTFHDVRHTCATLMLQAGEGIEVVSRVLGHADIRITAATYAHVSRGIRAGALDRLEREIHKKPRMSKVDVIPSDSSIK